VVGRTSGRLSVRVGRRNWAAELVHQTVVPRTAPGTMVYTDESSGYAPVSATGRGHATVSHNAGEWARDDDGDGVREVHCNTQEGIWTGLRNFLRPFRGVNKEYLEQYAKMFEWSHNLKRVSDDFLRVLLGYREAAPPSRAKGGTRCDRALNTGAGAGRPPSDRPPRGTTSN
jgi:transposase